MVVEAIKNYLVVLVFISVAEVGGFLGMILGVSLLDLEKIIIKLKFFHK